MIAREECLRRAKERLRLGVEATRAGRFAEAELHLRALHFWVRTYREQLVAEGAVAA